tara:strand:- start:675 stop:1319 length:645 start_codon:yes stop_codon:yes gene_type:complete
MEVYQSDFDSAGTFLANGKYLKAESSYKNIIKKIENIRDNTLDDGNLYTVLARAYMGLGFALDYLKKDVDALRALKKALKIDQRLKNNLILQTTIGAVYGDLGFHVKEIEHYIEVINNNPNFYKAYFNLALALGEMGRMNEAMDWLEKVVKIKPDYAKAYLQLAKGSELMGKYNRSIEYYLIARRLYSNAGNYKAENEINLRLKLLLKNYGKSS